MDHAVTIRDILLVICALGGLAGLATGALMMLAGGMADVAPGAKQSVRSGCVTAIVGLIVLGLSIRGLL